MGILGVFIQNQFILSSFKENSSSGTKKELKENSNSLTELPERINLSGPFYAKEHQGLVRAGTTDLNSTIGYKLSKPMEITFTGGIYTTPKGKRYNIETQSFNIDAHHDRNKSVAFFIVQENRGARIAKDSLLEAKPNEGTADLVEKYGMQSIQRKNFDNRIQTLIGYDWLRIKPNETSLDNYQIPVFHVWKKEK